MEEKIKVLKLLNELLKGTLWVIGGSTSLALQGVNIESKDIDILTDGENAEIIHKILERYCITEMKYSSSEKFRSYFGKYMINNIKIEVMGDLQHHLDNGEWSNIKDIRDDVNYIKVNDLQIPVFSLENELNAYKMMGRTEKVKLIEAALNG